MPRQEGWYNLSTHFPWIGMRTADPDGAHVEYFRGIRNPIGVKVGPATSARVPEAADRHPATREDEPGRLTLIHRFGATRIARSLPPLIEAARSHRQDRSCGAATRCTATRASPPTASRPATSTNILGELDQAFDIHAACGSRLGGVHIELTGEDVTECIGGARGPERGRPEARLPVATRSAAELRAGARNGAVHRAQDERRRGSPLSRRQ